MNSMTGFGKSSTRSSQWSLDITLKAINGRFLDVKIHGPRLYSPFEIEIRKLVSQYFHRGTVDVYINRKSFGGEEKIHFNKPLAKQWLKEFKKLGQELNLAPAESSTILLSIPDLVKVEDVQSVSAQEKVELFKCLDKAINACKKVRASEGRALKKDIMGQIKSLHKEVLKIKKLRSSAKNELFKKYEKKLESYKMVEEVDEQRLAQEVIYHIEKSDINEEIQRLEAHINAIGQLVKSSGSLGKKMDFYAQELLREVNTIGSKSSNATLTASVVEAKGLIEKYREQVQNVE